MASLAELIGDLQTTLALKSTFLDRTSCTVDFNSLMYVDRSQPSNRYCILATNCIVYDALYL